MDETTRPDHEAENARLIALGEWAEKHGVPALHASHQAVQNGLDQGTLGFVIDVRQREHAYTRLNAALAALPKGKP